MAKFDDIFAAKLKFLEAQERKLNRKVSAAERRLFELILDEFISKIETSGGVITANGSNISLVDALNEIFDTWTEKFHSSVVGSFGSDLLKVTERNALYFNEFTTSQAQFNRIDKRAKSLMRDTIGINKNGSLSSGGFLDDFLGDSTIRNEIKQLSANSIAGGRGFNDFRDELRVLIQGNENVGGRLQRHYRTFAYDQYQEFDRINSKVWADELQMESFIYSGGKIKTTRQFCCERNGLIFTRDEAAKWQNLSFDGKPSSGYDPLVNLGGHNCRHNTKWISNVIAANRRPDLKLNSAGELVSSGKNKQRLNKGCIPKK